LEETLKIQRHKRIIELINEYDIETQEELADKLNQSGYNVTQATVSRDIRQLRLIKKSVNGKQKYIVLQNEANDLNEKYIRILKDGFVSMAMAQNILVIKTVSGMAMAVAAALDAMEWPEIVGSIAGDDTVMCAIGSVDETILVMDKLKKLINA
jgi:transcriptional regulator of arginine metabolism